MFFNITRERRVGNVGVASLPELPVGVLGQVENAKFMFFVFSSSVHEGSASFPATFTLSMARYTSICLAAKPFGYSRLRLTYKDSSSNILCILDLDIYGSDDLADAEYTTVYLSQPTVPFAELEVTVLYGPVSDFFYILTESPADTNTLEWVRVSTPANLPLPISGVWSDYLTVASLDGRLDSMLPTRIL